MIDCVFYKKRKDGVELCETYSIEHYKLKQIETDLIYGSSVIDIIEGYMSDGKPYSRFTYVETKELDEDWNNI